MVGILQKYQDALLLSLRGARYFKLAPSSLERDMWDTIGPDARNALVDQADSAFIDLIPPLSLDHYLIYHKTGDQSEFLAAYHARRTALNALTLGSCAVLTEKYIPEIARLIWAICEESAWTLPASTALSPADLKLPDAEHPKIDAAAARTAYDLSLVAQLLEAQLDGFSPQLIARIRYELERRIIAPFLHWDDFQWMLGPRADAMKCIAGVTAAFLTFEEDGGRRWQLMRRAWRLTDRLTAQFAPDGSVLSGLGAWQSLAGDLMDILMMVAVASGSEADARGEPLIARLCRFPVNCHLARGFFINPGQRAMRPPLNGAELFRIGVSARDAHLCDLGAYLHKTGLSRPRPVEDDALFRRVMDAFNHQPLADEPLTQPLPGQVYLPEMQLMVARARQDDERGLAFSMHGGGNGMPDGHPDVGDIALFSGGEPVLIDAGALGEGAWHNLPVVGGWAQGMGVSHRALDDECRWDAEYALLTLNLKYTYPPEAGIERWQRTALLGREGGAQLIDWFDLAAPAEVRFHFITPARPSVGDGYAQLGAVRMRWEAPLDASVDEVGLTGAWARLWGDRVYRLTLTTDAPIASGKFAFSFKEVRTYGV